MTAGDDVNADFLTRVPSFSLIYFTGDVYEGIPEFLTQCGYKILAEGKREDSFFEVINAIDRIEARTVVSKAAYRVTGGTVLLDPEMVVASLYRKHLERLCVEGNLEVFIAIWERVSETIIAGHRSAQGVLVDVALLHGQPQKPSINHPPQLAQHPDPYRLKAFLKAAGVPVDEVFGRRISARTFRLDGSSMR